MMVVKRCARPTEITSPAAGKPSPDTGTRLPVRIIHRPGDGLHFIDQPRSTGHTRLVTPEMTSRLFVGRARLSLGPVLMYAELFIGKYTSLDGLAEAFQVAYPGRQPRMPLDYDYLASNYIIHIHPIDPGGRTHSNGLWYDLTVHGLNRLAEVIVLAAQDKAYREATSREPPYRAKEMARVLVRSLLMNPPSPARHSYAPSQNRRGDQHE